MYIALTIALGATIWANYHSARIVGSTSGKVHGVPVRKVKLCICIILIASLALSFALADTDPMQINAQSYSDILWLRTANMFVSTGIIAILLACAATLYNLLTQRK